MQVSSGIVFFLPWLAFSVCDECPDVVWTDNVAASKVSDRFPAELNYDLCPLTCLDEVETEHC